MYFKDLYLEHFRNYNEENWQPTPHLNVLHGENGQGKTNLLEAMQILTLGHSPRARKDRELIAFSASGCRLKGEIQAGDRHLLLTFTLGEGKKSHLLNQLSFSQGLQFAQKPAVVFFSPTDLRLVQGAPAFRRRYLDQILIQVYPTYREGLYRYWRGLTQRNALLREIRARRAAIALLSAWDEEIAESGARITMARSKATGELAIHLSRISATLSETRIDLEYRAGSGSFENGKINLREIWEKTRGEDLARGITTHGPHRDDLSLVLNGREAGTYGSQGQQRTLALGMRLAEITWLEERMSRRPILLLDDVFSELDPGRRRRLIALLSGEGQVMLTCTDLGQLPTEVASRGENFRVENGKIYGREG